MTDCAAKAEGSAACCATHCLKALAPQRVFERIVRTELQNYGAGLIDKQLVVALNKEHTPVASYHSRAGGKRHGLTCAVEIGDRLVVASKGGGELGAARAALTGDRLA